MAKILKFCDDYLKKTYNTTLIEIMYTEIDYKPELIIDILIANPDIKKLFDDYDLYGEIKSEDGDGSGFGDDIDFGY